MTLPSPTSAPGWVLHVDTHIACASTLVYDFGGGIVCKVHVTPARASLLQAVEASRESDERDGKTVNVGDRSVAELGRLVALMAGSGNRVSAKTIEGYKQAITREVKKALRAYRRKQTKAVPETPFG